MNRILGRNVRPLTDRQSTVWSFVSGFLKDEGGSLSRQVILTEAKRAIPMAELNIERALHQLVAKGLLVYRNDTEFGYALTTHSSAARTSTEKAS